LGRLQVWLLITRPQKYLSLEQKILQTNFPNNFINVQPQQPQY
jgi:hypothetical protein